MAQRRDFHRVRSQRRLTVWDAGVGGTGKTSVTSLTPQFMGSALVPLVEGLTIIRLRGELLIQLTLATAAKDGMAGAVGIGIATLAAVTAGIGAVPTPITEQGDENWLWWQAFSVTCPQIGSAASEGLAAGGSVFRAVIDSKAMRKFPIGTSLYAAVEVGTETGAAAIDGFLDTRILLKLS